MKVPSGDQAGSCPSALAPARSRCCRRRSSSRPVPRLWRRRFCRRPATRSGARRGGDRQRGQRRAVGGDHEDLPEAALFALVGQLRPVRRPGQLADRAAFRVVGQLGRQVDRSGPARRGASRRCSGSPFLRDEGDAVPARRPDRFLVDRFCCRCW